MILNYDGKRAIKTRILRVLDMALIALGVVSIIYLLAAWLYFIKQPFVL